MGNRKVIALKELNGALTRLPRNELLRLLDLAKARIVVLEKMDSQAATYVESVICMRTHFTGDPPYVGWRGLGLALREALDERDRLRRRAR